MQLLYKTPITLGPGRYQIVADNPVTLEVSKDKGQTWVVMAEGFSGAEAVDLGGGLYRYQGEAAQVWVDKIR